MAARMGSQDVSLPQNTTRNISHKLHISCTLYTDCSYIQSFRDLRPHIHRAEIAVKDAFFSFKGHNGIQVPEQIFVSLCENRSNEMRNRPCLLVQSYQQSSRQWSSRISDLFVHYRSGNVPAINQIRIFAMPLERGDQTNTEYDGTKGCKELQSA